MTRPSKGVLADFGYGKKCAQMASYIEITLHTFSAINRPIMRKLVAALIAISVCFFMNVPHVSATGGGAGVVPATGIKIMFGGGGTEIALPVVFYGEATIGDEEQHGVGAYVGVDIGVGGFFNLGGISPTYKYYFNGAKESGPFVGASVDVGFGSSRNAVGLSGHGGYTHFLTDGLSLYAAGSAGFTSLGFKSGFFGTTTRTTLGSIGVRLGLKYSF